MLENFNQQLSNPIIIQHQVILSTLSRKLPRNGKQNSTLSRRPDEFTSLLPSIAHKLACPIFMKNKYELNHFYSATNPLLLE